MKKIKILFFLGALILSFNVAQAQWQTSYPTSGTLSNSQGLPDLVITKVALSYIPSQARIYTGNTIQVPVEVTIKNAGKSTAKSSHPMRTYLYRSGATNSGVNNYYRKAISPGKSIKLRMRIHLPLSLNGKRVTFTAVTDAIGRGVIEESEEYSNNKKTASLQLPRFRPAGKPHYSL